MLLFPRFSVSLIYFALSLNAGTLAGDLFINTFLLGVVEIPATAMSFIILQKGIIGKSRTSLNKNHPVIFECCDRNGHNCQHNINKLLEPNYPIKSLNIPRFFQWLNRQPNLNRIVTCIPKNHYFCKQIDKNFMKLVGLEARPVGPSQIASPMPGVGPSAPDCLKQVSLFKS